MTDPTTPGAPAPDPFTRVLPFEPGDRVHIDRIYPNPPVPGVVLGPSRPRYAWGTVTGTFSYDEESAWDVRIVENGRYVVESVPDEYLKRIADPRDEEIEELSALLKERDAEVERLESRLGDALHVLGDIREELGYDREESRRHPMVVVFRGLQRIIRAAKELDHD